MNREIFRVPVVAPHNYEAFRALIDDAPATHGGWIELMQKRQTEESHRGFVIRDVHVNPEKFASFCRGRGRATNFVTLWHFVEETDPQNNYR
ncbi:MAG: hypothetical protein OJJ21_23900 [Ferrovibrio sp.]|uniref:hypothetical protein n=1 Tax=Ferrovibrio sp. TaxID=1917215 RepID=UPI0026279AAE|nr:hypothetical protein [Ferrovibrio sp.]MCW0236662.1 hypothetical protein [Ferrovibrio sp.]